MIIFGQLMLPDPPRSVRLVEGWLRIDGNRIAEVHEDERPASFDHGGEDTLICPGLIDTHLHLPQFDIIGAHGMTLLDWLHRVTFPAERKWEDADYAAAMTHRVIDQLYAVGTTGIAAYATVHHDAAGAAIEVCRDRGIHAAIGQVLMDRRAPDYLIRPVEVLLRETRDLLERFGATGRVGFAVTPRFAVSCSEPLLHGAGELAAAHGALIQTHLAETRQECEIVREQFGKGYVEVYHDTGLHTPRSIFGHGIHLSEDEHAMLRDSSAMIAHCPTANSFLRSGTMHRVALHEAEVRTCLGSDIGGGYERSMVRVVRAMIETAATFDTDPPSATEAWWQITEGNADALGWSRSGRLAPDAEADLVLIEPDIPWRDHVNPLSMLLFAWDDRWVRTTIAYGQVVFASRD